MRPRSIMVDIETLGTNKRSVIQSIGAVAFDDDGFLNDYEKIRPTVWYGQVPWRDPSQINLGRIVDSGTLEWWDQQGKALQILRNPQYQELQWVYPGLAPMLTEFSRFVKAEMHDGGKMLSKGIDFDLAIIETGFTDLGLPLPWRYNQTRCLRGFTDAAVAAGISQHIHMGVFGGNAMKHHAAEDAIFQTKVYLRYNHELWKIRHKSAQVDLFAPVITGAQPMQPPPGRTHVAYTGLTPDSAEPKLDPAP